MTASLRATLFGLLLFTSSFAEGPVSEAGFEQPGRRHEGIVAVWAQNKEIRKDQEPEAALGDTLIVRVRNFDGVMIEYVKNGKVKLSDKLSRDQIAAWLEALEALKFRSLSLKDLLKEKRDAAAAIRADKTMLPNPRLADADKLETEAKDIEAGQHAFNQLVLDAKARLFLVLGSARLRAITTKNAFAPPHAGPTDEDTDWDLEFRIMRKTEDEKDWRELYSGAHYRNPVEVRLGGKIGDDEFLLDTAVKPGAKNPNQRFNYLLFRPWRFGIAAGLVLAAVFIFFHLAETTDILRDTDVPLRPDGRYQFSLSRTQMAFWFFIVLSAFVFLWVVTTRSDTLNGTALGLIGIGAATAIGSTALTAMVQKGPPKNSEVGEKLRATAPTSELAKPLKFKRLDEAHTKAVGEELQKLKHHLPSAEGEAGEKLIRQIRYLELGKIGRFLSDLITDGDTVQFHRFQMIVWTLVLGLVFVFRVVEELEMPIFSDTLLGLLGISGGTYLSFKVPEIRNKDTHA